MARQLSQIIRELDTAYDPRREIYNKQIKGLDPLREAEEKGLEATKRDAFGEITNQANRRGLFYSGIPIAEEQRYTGGTYLPAVANLKNRYLQQKFNLQDALAGVTQQQYERAYDIRQREMELEAAERASLRAARAGGGGGGGGFDFSNLLDTDDNTDTPAKPRISEQIWGQMVQNPNPYVWFDFLRDARRRMGGIGYGKLASWVERNMGQRIANGSAADLALRRLFLGTNLETGGREARGRGGGGGGSF